MDKNIITHYGSDIPSCNIKTARQKKRAVKTDADKQLLRLHKEQKNINAYQKTLGFVPIHPPIVRGWKRFFVLRADVARSRYANFYQNILDKINVIEYCNRKYFKTKYKNYRKQKHWMPIEQAVKILDAKDFAKCQFT